MGRQIIVYGHGDKSESGFKTPQALVSYLEGGIFAEEGGRYRYSQAKAADVIVVARDGFAFGHLETDEAVTPSIEDRNVYPPVKKVYLVRKSVCYETPVRLATLGISNYRFGRYIGEELFGDVLKAAGNMSEYTGS